MDDENGRVSPAHPPATDLRDEQIDLMAYLMTLWRRRWFVVASVLLFGAAAFGLGKLSDPIYEATLKLAVAPPKTAQIGDATPTVTVASFKSLIENQSLAARIIQKFSLGGPPYRITQAGFLCYNVTVETGRDSNVVTIRVRLPEPELAAKMANEFGDLAVELAQQLSQEETVRARDLIGAQLEVSRKRLDDAESRLAAFRREPRARRCRNRPGTSRRE